MANNRSDNLGRLSDRVYALIKKDILAGRLKPGEHLPLEETAQSLGVSTTPVRDAFGLLAVDGLVEWRPRRGAFVANLTAREVEEIYQVREFLECCALEYALQKGGPAIAEMQELTARIAAAPVGDERAGVHARAELDVRFHSLPIRCVDNSRLSEIHASLSSIITIGAAACPLTAARAAEVSAEHQAVVDALGKGDLQGARAAMCTHLGNARAHLLQCLKAEEVQG